MQGLNTILFWTAVTLYGTALMVDVIGGLWEKSAWEKTAGRMAGLAVVMQSLQIIVHWYQVGHGPYITRFEVLDSDVWVAMVLYLLARWRYAFLNRLAPFFYGVAFLILGLAGVATTPEAVQPPLTFQSWWLVLHILFAKVAFGSLLLSFLAAMVHFRAGKPSRFRWLKDAQPKEIDSYVYRFAALSFAATTVMILAGAIWAQHAWGTYWSWDNVETWSLVVWIFLGLQLHLMRTLGWGGKKLAWVSVWTFALTVFAFFGVVLIFPSIHEGYLVIL